MKVARFEGVGDVARGLKILARELEEPPPPPPHPPTVDVD